MKKYFFIFGLMCFFIQAIDAQNFSSAYDYLSYIKERNDKVAQQMWEYVSASAHSKRDKKIDKSRDELIQTIKDAKKELAAMPPYNGDATLRDSMVANLDFYLKMLNGDLLQAEEMAFESQKSYDAMQKYLKKQEQIDIEFSEQTARVAAIYKEFAEQNDIQIVEGESKLSKKVTQANLVYNYYNKVYLIFFHGYIAETFLVPAIEKEDTTAFQAWTDSLRVAYELGNKQITQIQGFGGDYNLKFSCQKALNHYGYVVNNLLPVFDRYFKAADNMKRQQVIIDLIPENSRTQKDIDKYNSAVEEYNTAIKDFNKTIDLFNKSRQENLKQWQAAKQTFFDRHVPK